MDEHWQGRTIAADCAERGRDGFIFLVKKLRDDFGIQRVDVLAHSMGNQIVLEALKNNAAAAKPAQVDQLIMAAPDVPRDAFEKQLPEIQNISRGRTLYVSGADKALVASKLLAIYPRAGDGYPSFSLALTPSTLGFIRYTATSVIFQMVMRFCNCYTGAGALTIPARPQHRTHAHAAPQHQSPDIASSRLLPLAREDVLAIQARAVCPSRTRLGGPPTKNFGYGTPCGGTRSSRATPMIQRPPPMR